MRSRVGKALSIYGTGRTVEQDSDVSYDAVAALVAPIAVSVDWSGALVVFIST